MMTEGWFKCLSSPHIFLPAEDKERFLSFDILELEVEASKETQETHREYDSPAAS
jgi:hypothetical protein